MSIPGPAGLLGRARRAFGRWRARAAVPASAPASVPAPEPTATVERVLLEAPLPTDDPQSGPLFERLRVATAPAPDGFRVDELGILTRTEVAPEADEAGEWLDLLYAVRHAEGTFVCVDLAAGHGRRLVRAARLVERVHPLPCVLVGVEPDPVRFPSLSAHFRDNGLDPARHRLLPAGSLALVSEHAVVDLLVLGERTTRAADVVAAGDALDARVKRVHVHGAIAGGATRPIAEALRARGWEERRGGQAWVNPRFFGHHEILAGLPRWRGHKPAGFESDVMGSLIRHSYFEGYWKSVDAADIEAHPLPPFDEEYLEWTDLLESVRRASGHYVMMELGAGFGRWAVRAGLAVRALNPMPFTLVPLEAEPTHFLWLREHFAYNGIDPDAHDLRQAAVSCAPGFTEFFVGKPGTWYGQRIVGSATDVEAEAAAAGPAAAVAEESTVRVPAVPLSDVLSGYPRVDLIDCDIQGHEAEVFACAMDEVTRRVRRVHIGTHTRAIEVELRAAFAAHGWVCLWDYPCGVACETPFGLVTFQDGVQSWVNPALD